MNERIEQLAEQADDYAYKQYAKRSSGHDREYCFKHDREYFFKQKFAELIVRECLELTKWKDKEMSSEQRIRYEVYQDIKKHFGVEE